MSWSLPGQGATLMLSSGARWRSRLVAVPVGIGLVLVAACASSAGEAEGPSCNEELQATGEGLPVAPGIAIGVSYQIEVTHPELGGVIDAVVGYHRANPRFVDLDDPEAEVDVIGGGETGYIGTLLVLAERPDLATPEILDALEQAAREGGMSGVDSAVQLARPGDPPPYGDDEFLELGVLVFDRSRAVEDSDLEPLPARWCPAPDRDG